MKLTVTIAQTEKKNGCSQSEHKNPQIFKIIRKSKDTLKSTASTTVTHIQLDIHLKTVLDIYLTDYS